MKNLKLSIVAAMSIGIIFTGCGENSDEAEAYNIEQWLDNGDNQKVIDALGDCSSYSGSAKEQCYLNVGAAYFGKAKFDMISLSKSFADINDSLSDDAKSKEFNNIIFEKLDNPDLKIGLTKYKNIVDGNSSVCSEAKYDDLNKNEKQACLSINPMLISNIVNDNNDTNKSTTSVSLEDVIAFKDVLKDAVPELKSEDLLAIISGDTLGTDKDANANNVLDSVEATNYALRTSNSQAWNGDANVTLDLNKSNVYNGVTNLSNVEYFKIKVHGASNDNYFHKLTQKISGTNNFTTLTTDGKSCTAQHIVSDQAIDGITYFPCVKLKTDGNVTSLNDSIVNILNQNDDLIKSIALASESEDDIKSDTQKINDFKTDICDGQDDNETLCTGSIADGNLTITQDALIQFMNKR